MGYVDRVPTQYRFFLKKKYWNPFPPIAGGSPYRSEKKGDTNEKANGGRRGGGREGRALVGVTAPANGRGGGNVLRGKKKRRRVDDEKEEVTSVPPSPSPHIPDWGFRTPKGPPSPPINPPRVSTPLRQAEGRRDGHKRGIDRFGK